MTDSAPAPSSLADLTDAEVGHIKAALSMMIDGKVAALRDRLPDTMDALAREAREHLGELRTPGALLFGDLADGIIHVRDIVMTKAALNTITDARA